MHGNGFLRCLGLARTYYPVHDGAGDVHVSFRKVDVTPFQSEQLALPQARGHWKENQRSFSNAQFVYQCLDFTGHQDDWHSPPLCTLTNEVDRIAVEQLVSAGVIEKNRHQISDFGTTALRKRQASKSGLDLYCSDLRQLVLVPVRANPPG